MDSAHQTRLFLTLWPDPAPRQALHAGRDDWTWPATATLVAPEKLHLTLHFLGAIDNARIPDLRRGLAVAFSPFTLALGLPTLWQHGVAVLEPHTVPAELLELHDQLAQALRALAIQPEARHYRPHVTLAYRAAHARLPTTAARLAWQVDGYALVASTPHVDHSGAYTVLQTYPT